MAESRRGRPRSESSRRSVLEATKTLLISDGYEQMSVGEIASSAGVGKQTVYRWWTSKAEIVAEAVLSGVIPLEARAPTATDDLAADLRTLVGWFTSSVDEPGGSALIRALASAAAGNEEVGERLWERFTLPARSILTRRLQDGVRAGEVRHDADITVAVDALIGSLVFLVLSRQPVTTSRFAALTDVILQGITEPADQVNP
ncbi:TetR/AcrR family transcriptional regulator [Brevibacterium sp. CFH 10365]|uniref:TetR/AcrR family transcriptional regulator n=1 Tax=Brevibacterium sp. CFH 10365 TaxID=2585207 RepID=UPI00126629AE|nr:TetR/AcrR family transcriptional regulator [Brevibacterium sp. CFH 10365]